MKKAAILALTGLILFSSACSKKNASVSSTDVYISEDSITEDVMLDETDAEEISEVSEEIPSDETSEAAVTTTAAAKTTKKAVVAPTQAPFVKYSIGAYDSELAKKIKTASGGFMMNSSSFTPDAAIVSKLKNLVLSYPNPSGFYAVDIKSGASIFYNPDGLFNTGSSIKCPYVLCLCKHIDAGNIDPSEKLTYTSFYERDGSGVIKNYGEGKVYTVKELIHYTIHESDNSAYYMLFARFGNSIFNSMLDTLGIKSMHVYGGYRYGKTTPRDMALVWAEVTRYISSGSNMGLFFKTELTNALYNQFKTALPNETIMHKGGWITGSYLDAGMVVLKQGSYLIGVFTQSSGGESDKQFLRNITLSLNDLMKSFFASGGADVREEPTTKPTSKPATKPSEKPTEGSSASTSENPPESTTDQPEQTESHGFSFSFPSFGRGS